MTKLCAGVPHNQRHNHQFLKVIILFAYKPHTHTNTTRGSLNAVQSTHTHKTTSITGLPFIVRVNSWCLSAATSSSNKEKPPTSASEQRLSSHFAYRHISSSDRRFAFRMTHCRLIWWANKKKKGKKEKREKREKKALRHTYNWR